MITTGRVLARNTVLNIIGQTLPMFAALISIPILIRNLGASRFGILTLAWAAIGYFSLFDFGLGRALTQAVAERLGSNESRDDLGTVAWTALLVMFAFGVVGGAVLAALAPWLVRGVLHVPPTLQPETVGTFYLLASSLPIVVATAGLRGLLEAHQDFGAATLLRIPLAVFTFLAPLAVLPYSTHLVPIVAVLVVGRCITGAAHLLLCLRRYDYLRGRPRPDLKVMVPLLQYGGWMTASNIASPVMVYLDRFFIGAVLAMTAVAHYVTPYEIVTKLLIVPGAIIAVVFPAFASSYVVDRTRTAALFERSLRMLIVMTFPVLLLIVVFAQEGLRLWVGASFAEASAPVLRWLALGVFANSLAQAPFALLQGTGRPDITAKLHLIELPLYVLALAWMAHAHGIVGVAIAWTVRVTLDAAILMLLACRRLPADPAINRTLFTGTAALGLLAAGAMVEGAPSKIIVIAASIPILAWVGWTHLLQPAEREFVRSWSHR